MRNETLNEILSVLLILTLILLTCYIETINIHNFVYLYKKIKHYESQNFGLNFEHVFDCYFDIIDVLH